MRIKRIVLENHRYITVFRSNIINKLVTDVDLTVGNFFKSRNHTESGGFTAARRSYENDKFLVFNFKVKIRYGSYSARISFVNMTQ